MEYQQKLDYDLDLPLIHLRLSEVHVLMISRLNAYVFAIVFTIECGVADKPKIK